MISIISGYELDGVNGLGQKARESIKDYLPKPVGLGDLSALLARMFEE